MSLAESTRKLLVANPTWQAGPVRPVEELGSVGIIVHL